MTQPPELLASIVERFEQLSHDLWPDDPPPDSKDEAKLQSVEDMQELWVPILSQDISALITV